MKIARGLDPEVPIREADSVYPLPWRLVSAGLVGFSHFKVGPASGPPTLLNRAKHSVRHRAVNTYRDQLRSLLEGDVKAEPPYSNG